MPLLKRAAAIPIGDLHRTSTVGELNSMLAASRLEGSESRSVSSHWERGPGAGVAEKRRPSTSAQVRYGTRQAKPLHEVGAFD